MNPKEVSVMVPLEVFEATIEMLLVKEKGNIEKLLTQEREYLKNLLEKDKTIFQLEQQLADFKYYKLLLIARNEIEKYDAFAWNTNFQYVREDLEYIKVYEDRQVEKRRLRWLHLLKHSDEILVRRIRNSITERKITIDEFALNIAQAYRELSKKNT